MSEARLQHVPALDGLRGVAVVGVLAFHLGHLRGGYLGVDLFFVLSGFLITSLLLVERDATGGIDLIRFWARRARRLLPALFLVLLAIAAYAATDPPAVAMSALRGDALATLGYVANWHSIVADHGYWELFSAPSLLAHTWS
ncbi:MAG TPA: acyltransferase, partial [Acidimicrobiales bacterium]|nr:acyltransferase [Acidimicrobiales bacterium]